MNGRYINSAQFVRKVHAQSYVFAIVENALTHRANAINVNAFSPQVLRDP